MSQSYVSKRTKMANKLTSMQTLRTILQLAGRSFTGRAIARELKLSRNTVSHYLQQIQATQMPVAALQAMDNAALASLLYPSNTVAIADDKRHSCFCKLVPYFLSELKRTGVTRHLLWREYLSQNPDGYRYSQFCFHLKEQSSIVAPSFVNHYKPGETMMVDFAGDPIYYINKETGEQIACPVLVCVLPYSNYTYAEALPNATLPFLVAALNRALHYFKGAPLALKTDNMKQVVVKSNRYEPTFTDLIQQWSLHYNISLVASRPYKPKDKAPVENHVKIVYNRLYAPLRDNEFFSLEALNEALAQRLELHNEQRFQGKTYSRSMQFKEEEQAHLNPLPVNDFEIRHSASAKVQKNYHITLGEDWNYYSVPCQYIGKQVTAIYDTEHVEIYLNHERIALHRRSTKQHAYTTNKEHRQGWDGDYFLRQAATIGPSTQAYIAGMLKSRCFTEQTFNACKGLMRLAKDYSAARLEAACTRALPSGSYVYKIIANILKNNLDKDPGTSQTTLFQMPEHDNIRGREAYQ
jgi:transposase